MPYPKKHAGKTVDILGDLTHFGLGIEHISHQTMVFST